MAAKADLNDGDANGRINMEGGRSHGFPLLDYRLLRNAGNRRNSFSRMSLIIGYLRSSEQP